MELSEALARRKTVRAFDPRPVPAPVLDRILGAALRGPSAGFTQGFDLVVLEGADQTSRFWDVTLPVERRASFPWPGLLEAPVLLVPLADAAAYLERYSEPDKAGARGPGGPLGARESAWPVPYWVVDTAFASMLALLAAVDEELGACFFGIFDHEQELLDALGVPSGHRPIGAMAIGYPAAVGDRSSRSVSRGRRPFDEVIHRGSW